jgi:hypothetical protein
MKPSWVSCDTFFFSSVVHIDATELLTDVTGYRLCFISSSFALIEQFVSSNIFMPDESMKIFIIMESREIYFVRDFTSRYERTSTVKKILFFQASPLLILNHLSINIKYKTNEYTTQRSNQIQKENRKQK